MNNETDKLIQEFIRIANKKWIKGIGNSSASIGITFENELGKKLDSSYFPDYYGIELKCTSRYSHYPITLFSVAFDGPTFPEINRIIEKYGWYDKDYPDKKVLFTNLHYKKKTVVNYQYLFRFKLQFDKEKNKLYLCIYNSSNKLIEKESFVYTDSISNHLRLKLKKLAIIHASTKRAEQEKYFRYYSIDIYELIGMDRFMELLINDDIDVSLIAKIEKSGVDKGKHRNKNLVFKIDKNKVELLFKKIFSYNHYNI